MPLRATLTILLLVSVSAICADYLFPSSNPPAGKQPNQVKQFIVFTWDDNAYSGKRYTQYEDEPNGNYQNSSWIGGEVKEGGGTRPKDNALKLKEGDMGMSWAAVTLAGHIPVPYTRWVADYAYNKDTVVYNDSIWYPMRPWPPVGAIPQTYPDTLDIWSKHWVLFKAVDHTLTRKNPDGSPLHFTFNAITGLFVPVWPIAWESRESKYGFWKPTELDYPNGQVLHTKIAVSWGREMQILDAANGKEFQENFILNAFKETRDFGHEIGNHTIDHMESNSPLPNDSKGFGRWGGEGFDKSPMDTMPWGEVIDEAKLFGQKPGASAQTMGWKINAGRFVSKKAWAGAIALAEEELDINLGISVKKGNCFGFRAPRLEIGSGLFWGLKELGYQYDCGVEEGYQENIEANNTLWPFTTDNSYPYATYLRSLGERVTIDSMPSGLWLVPSNVIVVPPEIRKAVYDNHYKIAIAAPDGGTVETFEEWVSSGAKITAYDFNIWILWGMTKANWLTTMQYNLSQHLAGNKAPLHYAVHTDYYTPIYDNAVLLTDFNKTSYGLNVSQGWNTWRDRISAMETFVDWALEKGCYFVTGHELIEEIKNLQKDEQFGKKGYIPDATWEFFKNANSNCSSSQLSFTDNITNAQITVDSAHGDEYPYCGYGTYKSAGYFKGLTHIELTYRTTAPLSLILTMANDQPWEVTLGNLGPEVSSGRIPLSAFHYNEYDTVGTNTSINTADITGIELQCVTSGKNIETHSLSAKNLFLYGAEGSTVGIDTYNQTLIQRGITLKSITRTSLRLDFQHAGAYTVRITNAQGKLIKTFNNFQCKAGINNLKLNSIAGGVYLITINNPLFNVSFKSLVM